MGVRLSIDYWHTTLAAALRTSDGRVIAVAIDGAAVTPTGVAVDGDGVLHPGRMGADMGFHRPESYLRIPGQRLSAERIDIGAVTVDPVDVVAASLAQVLREADLACGGAPLDEVVIATPAGWVSHQRTRLRAAAQRARLGIVRLVGSAESIVDEQMRRGTPVAVGSVVVVCRFDATVGELVVLRRDVDGYTQLAMADLGELGHTPGATLTEQAATALANALDAASLGGGEVTAVFCLVPAGVMPALSQALTASAGLAAAPVQVGELAAAFGAARPPRSDPQKMSSRWPWARLTWSAFGVAVAWSGAALLTYQMFQSSTVYAATSVSPATLITQWYAWGLVPVLAMLGMVSMSIVASDVRAARTGPGGDGDGRDPALGLALALSAVVGVGTAVVLSLMGAARFTTGPSVLLKWTLLSSLPVAVVIATLGLVIARGKGAARWRDQLRFPLEALAPAVLSTVSLVAAYTGIPRADSHLWWTMEHVGGFGIGWAVALLLSTNVWRRLILGCLLGVVAVYAIGIGTAGVIVAALIATITVWWVVRLVRVVKPVVAGIVAEPGTATMLDASDTTR